MNAMAAAMTAAGFTPPTDTATKATPKVIDVKKGKRRNRRRGRQFGTSGTPATIQWSHDAIGNIQIALRDLPFSGEIHQIGANTWSKIDLRNKKPRKIELETLLNLNEDAEVIWACGKKLVAIENETVVPDFFVNIDWKPADGRRDSDEVPHLRHDDQEDFQLYVMNKKTGFFVHLDVTVSSRKGGFWVVVQEVLGAQVLWHPADNTLEGYTSVVIGERAYTLVPVYAENAYPGNDPIASIERTYPGRTKELMGHVAKWDVAVDLDHVEPGEWQPQWPTREFPELKAKGYEPAVVMWFNLTIGFGFVQLEDGRQCMAHFKSFEGWDGKKTADGIDFPYLEAGKGCYVLPKQDPGKPNPRAVALRKAP
jgi:cold shock CspA family protein